jgi:hypothetical protein
VFVGLALLPAYKPTKAAILFTTQDQIDFLRSHCNLRGTTISGFVYEASLRTSTVEFTVKCDEKRLHMNIPKTDVKGLIIVER